MRPELALLTADECVDVLRQYGRVLVYIPMTDAIGFEVVVQLFSEWGTSEELRMAGYPTLVGALRATCERLKARRAEA